MRRPFNKNLFLAGKLASIGLWAGVFVWTLILLLESPWTGLRTTTRHGTGVVVSVDAGSPAERAGIRQGDAVQAVQGEAIPWQAFESDRDMLSSWDDEDAYAIGQGRLSEIVRMGQKLSLRVGREGRSFDVEIVPERMRVSAALGRAFWSNLLALAWMVVALLIVRKQRSLQTAGILVGSTMVALTMTTMGAGMGRELSSPVEPMRWVHLLNVVSATLQALSAAWFGLVFPTPSRWASWLLDRSWLFLAAGAAVVGAHLLRWSPAPLFLTYGFNGLGNLAFLVVLPIHHGASVHAVHRRQLQWLLLGCMVGTLPYVLLTELPLLMGWHAVSQDITCMASIAIPITIGFAINRWRLLEISGLFDEGVLRLLAIAAVWAGAWVGFAMVSAHWRDAESLPLLQALYVAMVFAAWGGVIRFLRGRARRSKLGMEALPPLVERLVRGEPLDQALAGFLSNAYRTTIFARVGPGQDSSTVPSPGSHWVERNRNAIREILAGGRGAALGFELAWKLGVDAPPDVENCLFLDVPRSGEASTLLALGPRWSPDWWTDRDVDRVRSLLKIAMPLGDAAETWHREELGKRSVLERAREELESKVAERTRDVEGANAQLRQALSAREDFLAQMSHELRSPLAAILGGVEAVLDGLDGRPTAAMVRRLEMIDRNGQHLLSLIQDILDFTRGRAGKLPIRKVACRIGTQIDAALEMVAPQLDGKRGTVEIHASQEAASALVSADPLRLRQILTNLCSNAMRHGKGIVEVVVEANPERVQVKVMDRGPGIPAEFMDRLFKPFERFGASGDHRTSTGLGLALSRQLASGMGATLEYSSREGGGAVFCLSLPRAMGQTDIGAARTAAASGAWVVDRSILVVDDQPDLLELCESYFGSLGWSVEAAADAEAALASLARRRPDALLTDLGLPGLDGCELVSRVRSLPGGDRICIVVLTGAAMPEDEARSLASGADLFRVKPVLLAEVANRLAALVEERSSASLPS